MIPRIQLLLVPVFIQFLGIVALTDNNDYVALKSLQDGWENVPPTWEEGSSDPCGDHWEGVGCNGSKVVSLTLSSMDLSGKLSGDIEALSELQILDLSYNKGLEGPLPREIGNLKNLYNLILVGCGFSGPIPDTIGSLSKLKYLSLNSNKFIGPIPPSLGKLSELYWLDLADNDLSWYSCPDTIGSLSKLKYLHLSNNNLEGPFPNLTDMSLLNYVDMSNNNFDPIDFPSWFSTLESLTTLVLDNTGLQGLIPPSLFSLVQLQSVIMRNNKLNGTLNIGTTYSNQLQLIDLRNNQLDSFTQRKGYHFQISLVGNPFCLEGSGGSSCAVPQLFNSSYSTPTNCLSTQCTSDQISSPNCKCAYPYTGNLVFRAPSFSNLGNSSIFDALQESMMHSFKSQELPVDSVSLSNPADNPNDYLVVHLQVFPNGMDHFNRTGVSAIGFALINQTFKQPPSFGPFFFQPDVNYKFFDGDESTGSGKSSSTGIIIGAAVGGSVLVILVLIIGVYAFCQKRKAQDAAKKNDPFASWDRSKSSGAVPQLQGAKFFSFEELSKCTNNFSEANTVGSGGYGKVYRGALLHGQLIAIKRSQQGSMQGAPEFKSEIELLSRVHHKNVVGLVGFCFDQGEQILIYEFIPNGTLKESLTGKSGIKLDWMRRLRIALGAAKGLQYLHDLVNPPIIHRDIKTDNILLDERLNAKVADFGISKSLGEQEKSHITTQVKGTMGYLDPEYYMTNQLTEKSDVYSFGVVLLEIITARPPIEKGKYIVREVKQAMDKTKDMYDLQCLLDPAIAPSVMPRSLEKFVDIALRCLEDVANQRPTMREVVKEIESIMEMVGLNPHADPASTSLQ